MNRPAPSIALVCACLAASLLAAPAAHATFPGADGKIAFHTNRDSGNFEIYSVNSNATGATRLTTAAGQDLEPVWSPDGAKIAFTSARDGNFEIYTMNADGSSQTRLTTNAANDVQPAWSPDGTKIVFATDRDGNPEIYTMNANGTSPLRLTTHAANDGFPNWSPDGTKIAFQTNRDGNFEIYTINTNGTSPTNLTNNAAYDEYPNWWPDGSRLLFDSNRNDGFFQLYQMNANGSNVVRQTNSGGNDEKGSMNPQQNGNLLWQRDITGDNDIITSALEITFNSSIDDGFPDWQPKNNSYVRPASASPLKVSLVPAYKQCTTPTTGHRGQLSASSCYGPAYESSYLTYGTPDVNGQGANSSGFLKITAFCNGGASGEAPPCLTTAGDQLDGRIAVGLADVRCIATTSGCSNGPLSDYTGNLRAEVQVRVTDKNNGLSGTGVSANGTVTDFAVGFNVPCATTASTSLGAICSVTTSIDAALGGNTVVQEQKRAIWQLTGSGSDVRVFDGGSDGLAQTTGDNTLYATAGVFFP